MGRVGVVLGWLVLLLTGGCPLASNPPNNPNAADGSAAQPAPLEITGRKTYVGTIVVTLDAQGRPETIPLVMRGTWLNPHCGVSGQQANARVQDFVGPSADYWAVGSVAHLTGDCYAGRWSIQAEVVASEIAADLARLTIRMETSDTWAYGSPKLESGGGVQVEETVTYEFRAEGTGLHVHIESEYSGTATS